MKINSLYLALVIAVFTLLSTMCLSQTVKCGELANYVASNYDTKDQVTCYNSTMLAKAEYYRVDNTGFVIGYLKSNDYDFSGKPYIFCGISQSTWGSFKYSGMSNSWGKAFHGYIMDAKCNCD